MWFVSAFQLNEQRQIHYCLFQSKIWETVDAVLDKCIDDAVCA